MHSSHYFLNDRYKAGFASPLVLILIGALLAAAVAMRYVSPPRESEPPALPAPSSEPPPQREEARAFLPPLPTSTDEIADLPLSPAPAPPPAPQIPPLQSVKEGKFPVEPTPRDIMLRSVAGVECTFENGAGDRRRTRGSGVFIHPSGYLLTNRHVVDLVWTKWAYEDPETDDSYKTLVGCEVRFLQSDRTLSPLPQPSYPFFDLKAHGGIQYDFKAELVYLPAAAPLSEKEEKRLDYAVLKITEKNPSKYFPNEDPVIAPAPLLVPDASEWLNLLKGKNIIAPGFTYQATGPGAFEEYRLTVIDGIISDVYAGDKGFANVPFLLETEMPPDAFGGRSGSPIFYRGYVIGLIQTKGLPSPEDPRAYLKGIQTSINAIMENLATQLGEAGARALFGEVNYIDS